MQHQIQTTRPGYRFSKGLSNRDQNIKSCAISLDLIISKTADPIPKSKKHIHYNKNKISEENKRCVRLSSLVNSKMAPRSVAHSRGYKQSQFCLTHIDMMYGSYTCTKYNNQKIKPMLC